MQGDDERQCRSQGRANVGANGQETMEDNFLHTTPKNNVKKIEDVFDLCVSFESF